MNEDRPQYERLLELASGACNDTLGPEGFEELSALLRDDPEARRVYLAYVQLDGGLRWEVGAVYRGHASPYGVEDPVAIADDPPIVEPLARFSGLRVTLAIAASLLIVGASFAVTALVLDQPAIVSPPKPPPVVGMVTHTEGVTWTSDELYAGDDVVPQTLAMTGGEAELMLSSRALVNVHGPAEIRIDGPMRVALSLGRATFTCPRDAVGFTVDLPDGSRVIDLGTQFTVRTLETGGARVLVTEGKVELHSVTPSGETTSRIVSAGWTAELVDGSIALQPTPDPAGDDYPETVVVGNVGNEPHGTGYGSVAYVYRIGKYEVTNQEYCEFLNAVAASDPFGLYDERMAHAVEDDNFGGILRSGSYGAFSYSVRAGMERKPVNYVSWESTLRFANWLSNGKGEGDTETGPYTFENGSVQQLPDHAALADGERAVWVLPTEDEWFKAAYFDPRKPGGPGYWRYADRSDVPSVANIDTGAPSDVGGFGPSAYGTHDQNGNVWEWNETRNGGHVGLRGGSFYLNDNERYMRAHTRYEVPSGRFPNYGFRIALLASP